MKRVFLIAALATSAWAQHKHPPASAPKSVTLLTGLGSYSHPIHTRSPQAQKFFDQGLNLYYGFNHDEAIRAFDQAAKLDPASPMPWWGKSLSLGRNYNRDEEPELEKAAYDALQEAQKRSVNAPKIEQDYVAALATRYSADPKADHKTLALAYKNAVCDLMTRYPDDLEAATFCAEAAMNLRPWLLYNKDGSPAEGTPEIVATLESVLRRDPQHPGANHYYIHAVEASNNPERALPSAGRLAALVPAAGHLVHMPAHIYIRTGDHDAAAVANERAASADRAYIAASGAKGMYPLMYYSHNLDFLRESNNMRGNYAGAKTAAERLVANVRPGVKEMPPLEAFLVTPYGVELRFAHWKTILAMPAPDKSLKLTTAMWHFARAVALASLDSSSGSAAGAERTAFDEARKDVPEGPYGLNSSSAILALASAVLDARISRTPDAWRKAVDLQDALNYDEPPGWYYPIRESLGGSLLATKQYADAERVFREDLVKNPRNPRSLFGLAESLKGQGRAADEAWVRREFQSAWKHADVTLSVPLL